MSMMMVPPLMHGAAQWASFNAVTMGGRVVIPDDVERMRPAEVLRLAAQERVLSLPVVGDAIARPLLDEVEAGDYDLSGLFTITNGGAPLSPTVRERILAALPHVMLLDAVGASESGAQMSTTRPPVPRPRLPRSRPSRTPPWSPPSSIGYFSPARVRAGWRDGI
jgi:3-oxocholest-4-en-26-oate---CoA ligase